MPPGCDFWQDERGYHFARVHYSADPRKDAKWARGKKRESASEALYRQEYEIDAHAQLGALMYPEFVRKVNVCKPFPIPRHWTRYMGIDPHKRRPHAFLWMAVSPDGDHWYYREYWPSKIYGKRGNVPEDDKLFQIDDYAKTVRWFEGPEVSLFSAGGFADNQGQQETIFLRIMDTHGKAIYAETHDGADEPVTFWDRYAECGIHCDPAKKDMHAGRDAVGTRLRPRRAVTAAGEHLEPVIHIFETLPELILELETVRWPTLTPAQAAKQDPVEKELQKRKHMADLIRYIEVAEPRYIEPAAIAQASLPPVQRGIAY